MELLPDYRSVARFPEMGLDLQHEPKIGIGKLLRSGLDGKGAETVEGTLHDMGRLQIVGGGMRICGVVIIRIELDARDVFLEQGDRNRAGELLTPSPDQIEPLTQHGREGINVLVPGAVEIAEEEQIIVLQ